MYKWYMRRATGCRVIAKACLDKGEVDLAIFYKNAAEGYEEKALEVKLCEA